MYIGAGDDGYYCINLKPKDGEADIVWHLTGERFKDCETCPVVVDGVMYAGLGVGGNALIAIDAEKGEELWRVPAPYPVFTPPSVANGKLYIGMGHGDFVFSADEVRNNLIAKMREEKKSEQEIAAATKDIVSVGEVWCIDTKTHKVDWKFKVSQTILGPVVIGQDRLYFASRDKQVYAVDFEGKQLARQNLNSLIVTAPALGQEHLYVSTGSGSLYCLDADTLTPVWEANFGMRENFFSSPTVARGRVYIGTPGGGLRCLGIVGEPPPTVWAHSERGGRVDKASVSERAILSWRYPKGGDIKIEVTAPLLSLGSLPVKPPRYDARPAADEKPERELSVFVPCMRDAKPELLKLSSAKDLDDDKRVLWAAPFKHPITATGAAMGYCLYVMDGKTGDADRTLRCISAFTSLDRWTLPVGPNASGRFTLDTQRLYMWTGPETLACYPISPAGSATAPAPLWTASIGPGSLAPEATDGVVFVATDAELAALDGVSGARLWPGQVKLPEKPTASPLRLGERIVVTTKLGVAAYRITDGTLEWQADVGPVRVSPAADFEKLAVVTEAGELVVLLLQGEDAGKEMCRRIPDADPSVPPVVASGRIVFQGGDLMVIRDLKRNLTDETRSYQWARTGWLGKVLTPVLVLDSCAYFATDKYGVICVRPTSQ